MPKSTNAKIPPRKGTSKAVVALTDREEGPAAGKRCSQLDPVLVLSHNLQGQEDMQDPERAP